MQMPRLICSICSASCDDLVSVDCPDCGGKIIDSRVKYAREIAEADEVDRAWDAYHAIREGDAAIAKRAEPTYSEGCLFKRQAGAL